MTMKTAPLHKKYHHTARTGNKQPRNQIQQKMGLFSKSTRDKDFDVEAAHAAAEPPLVTATPINYASASLPTPAQAISTAKINNASAATTNLIDIDNSNIPLGRHPTSIPICPHCSTQNVTTRTSTYPGIETWLLCFGILLICWPACWIPLVMDSAKRTDHVCSTCHAVVGEVKPFSDCCVKERG
mmetsp:Transcript_20575/g.44677  ORF Transcript_20575/g.44677 Transcript_20575/m.44677 type:complete len:185 (-) Transcript_20575:411-965(-)